MKRRPKAGSIDLCWARADTADIRMTERGGEKKKAMVALLVFIMATMMASFGLKNENCHVDKIIRLAQPLRPLVWLHRVYIKLGLAF